MVATDQVANYWDQAAEGAREESGGGVIGKGLFRLGFFCFVGGITGNDRESCVFLPDAPTKEAREKAKAKAAAFCAKHGVENPRWSFILRLYRDECVNGSGEAVTWEADRFEVVPTWTMNVDGPSAAKFIDESVRSQNVPGGEEFYGRFGWTADPYKKSLGEAGMTSTDAAGDPAFPRICYVIEVYADKDAALEAIGENGGGQVSPWSDFPGDDWEGTDFAELASDVENALMGFDGDDLDELASDEFDADEQWLIRALTVGGKSVSDIKKLTGLKPKAIKAHLA